MSAGSSGNRNARPGAGHPLLTGILIGLVTGVGLSAGVAVWIARMPSPFQNRAVEGAASADAARAAVATPASGSPVAPAGDGAGPRNALPAGNPPAASAGSGPGLPGTAQDASASGASGAPGAPARDSGAPTSAPGTSNAGNATTATGSNPLAGAVSDGSTPVRSSAAAGKALSPVATYLQVGAFGNEEDAQKQVETVAVLTGSRATVLPLQQGDRMIYRVRLGPYGQRADYAELADTLKANAISTTIVRVAGDGH